MKHAAKQARVAAGSGGLAGEILRWWYQVRLRQRRHRTAPRELTVQETLVLTPRQRLLLVRCAEERFLVGTGHDGVPSIVRLNAAAPVEDEESVDWERAVRRDRP